MAPVQDLGTGRGPYWLDDWLRANAGDVLAWRRHIHTYPELSRCEYGTTELVMKVLREVGLKPWVLPGGTGVVCDIGKGDRCVAHACGHDAHTAILMGAARALADAPELPSRIRFIFQPAEEFMPGGALDMNAAGVLEGVERIFGLHCDPRVPVGLVSTRVGALTSAADLIELRLTSPGGHTSRPHLTAYLVHALGTVITSLPSMLSRRVDPRSGTVLVWGAVHAGQAANAVPQDGLLRGTLRTADHEVWTAFEPLVASSVESLLAPTGVGFSLDYRRGVPPSRLRPGKHLSLARRRRSRLGRARVEVDRAVLRRRRLRLVPRARTGRLRPPRRPVRRGPQHDIHQPTFTLDERALLCGTRVLVHAALTSLA